MNKTCLKIAGILLSLVLTLSLFPNAVVRAADIIDFGYCGDQGDNVTWELDNEGTLYIKGSGAMKDYTEYLNSEGKSQPATDWFFLHLEDQIKKVEIDDGITHIGINVFFSFSNLTTITIPNTVTSIGWGAFGNCSSLKDITIPESVTSIGKHAFIDCTSLTSVVIPDGVSSIEYGTFRGCSNLKNVEIPTSVTSIGRFAFDHCTCLESIDIPKSVISIGEGAFNTTSLETVVIPNSETTIENFAFQNCSNLYYIMMPDNLISKYRDSSVFNRCPAAYFYSYFTVDCDSKDNGEVSFESYDLKNGRVILNVKPDDHYEVDTIKVTGAGITSEATNSNGVYSFPFDNYGNATVEATFKLIKHTVEFISDGEVVSSAAYDYGTDAADIKIPSDPSKTADAQYTYKFAGWDNDIEDVTGDATYTATYTSTINKYTVKFVNYDGTVLSSETYDYGTAAADIKIPAAPSKAADAKYTYKFAGWDKAVSDVKGDVTYTATYTSTINKYTVKFVNYDGAVLSSETYDYGTAAADIKIPAEPTRPEDEQYTYTYKGWDKAISDVKGDATYLAVFETITKPGYTIESITGDGITTDMVLHAHRNLDDKNAISYLVGVEVDNKRIARGDAYDAEPGSVIVTIHKDFLKSLGEGTHNVTIVFKDGSVSTTVTLKAPANVPATGETIVGEMTGGALVVLAAGLFAVEMARKKKKSTDKI